MIFRRKGRHGTSNPASSADLNDHAPQLGQDQQIRRCRSHAPGCDDRRAHIMADGECRVRAVVQPACSAGLFGRAAKLQGAFGLGRLGLRVRLDGVELGTLDTRGLDTRSDLGLRRVSSTRSAPM